MLGGRPRGPGCSRAARRHRHAPLRGRPVRGARDAGRRAQHPAPPAPRARVARGPAPAARLPAGAGERVAGLSEAAALPSPRRIEAQAVLCTARPRRSSPSAWSSPSSSSSCRAFRWRRRARRRATGSTAGAPPSASRDCAARSGTRSPSPSSGSSCRCRSPCSIAWLLARTDLPGRSWIEFAFWAAFFLPSFTVTLSWILLLDPEYGLVNTALAALPFVGKGPFNIYSFWGIVWVHLVTGSLTVKVILLTPAFAQHERLVRGGLPRRGGEHAAHGAPHHRAGDGPGHPVGAAARHHGVAADLRGRAGARPALPLLRVQHDDLRPARDARAALRRGHRARRPSSSPACCPSSSCSSG